MEVSTGEGGGLEGQTGQEHVLDQGRCRYEILQLEIEYPLQSLDAERPELGQLAEQPAKVVRFALRLRVVRDVIAQAADDLHLQLLDLFRLPETVAF